MKFQLHHQFKDGSLGKRYDFELSDDLSGGELYNQAEKHLIIAETKFPLAGDCTWLLCGEQSAHFVKE
jgi:hypothetical protein